MESDDVSDSVAVPKRVDTEDEGGESSAAATLSPEEELYAIAAAWISTGYSPDHPKAAQALEAERGVFERAVAAAPSQQHGALKELLGDEQAWKRLLRRIEETEAAVERLYTEDGIKSARGMHQHVTNNNDLTPTQQRAYEDLFVARDRLSDIVGAEEGVLGMDGGGAAQDNGAGGAAQEEDAGGAVESHPPATTTSTPKMQVDSASAQPPQEEQGDDRTERVRLSDLWKQFVNEAGRIPRAGAVQDTSGDMQNQVDAHYIRWCYDALWDSVLQNTLRCSCHPRTKMRGNGSVVLGSPGIGKTVYLLYILRRYLASKALRAIFPQGVLYTQGSTAYLMKMSGHVEVFEGDEFSWDMFADNNNLLVIIDPAEQALRPRLTIFDEHRPLIILTSPRQVHGELWKDDGLVATWMPVWTRRELAQCMYATAKDADHVLSEEEPTQGVVPTDADKLYAMYGGVPHHVMAAGRDVVEHKTEQLEQVVATITSKEVNLAVGYRAEASRLTHSMFHILVDYPNKWLHDREVVSDKPKGGMQHILGEGERRFYVDPIGTLRQTMFQRYRVDFASDFVETLMWIQHPGLYKWPASRVLLNSPIQEIAPTVMEHCAIVTLARGGWYECSRESDGVGVRLPKKQLKHLKDSEDDIEDVAEDTMYVAWPQFPAIFAWSSEGLFRITLANRNRSIAETNRAALNSVVAAVTKAYRKKRKEEDDRNKNQRRRLKGKSHGSDKVPLYVVTLEQRERELRESQMEQATPEELLQHCEQRTLRLNLYTE